MFWITLKTTLRSLYRDKLYVLINIAGLSLGMACCLILGLYLRGELTYDEHHANHERIYRIANEFTIDGRSSAYASSSALLGPMLADNFAGFQTYVRFRSLSWGGMDSDRLIRHEENAYYWRDVYFVDENVFDVFSHDILYGSPDTALVSPLSAAVSQSFAQKYFGDVDPVGETITLENGDVKLITLVFADLPDNTHLKYDVLLSYRDMEVEDYDDDARSLWGLSDFTYVLMPANYDAASYNAVSDAFFERYMTDHASYLSGTWTSWLQPLADIHLYSDLENDRPTGNRFYLYGFATVGMFILLVACINYVNLATARASRRSHEIGMRKILGATRLPLGLQFLGESVLLSMGALVIAVALFKVAVAFTPIAELLNTALSPDLAEYPGVLPWIVSLSLLLGILAGAYPAIYLSSFSPLTALMGSRSGSKRNSRFREFLALVQFSISIGIIASTMIMASQMKFVAERSLGFEKEGKVVITLHGVDLIEQTQAIITTLEQGSYVHGATAADRLLGTSGLVTFFETENNDGAMESVTTQMMPVAINYLEVMGMEFAAGRNFSLQEPADDTIIVNEAVVRHMNWAQPLGKRMGQRKRTVIGVVRDFNFDSLHKPVEPIAIYRYRSNFSAMPSEQRPFRERYLIVNIGSQDPGQALDFIEQTIAQFDSSYPFQYRFVDEFLDELYLPEDRLMKLVGTFSAISIFIACIGLFGLTSFATLQRTKEIGIRKVLGASSWQIVVLLCRRTLGLVIIGGLIASLASYIAMDAWLATFDQRIGINPVIFLLATVAVLAVAFITIALQSYKVASENPIEALRFE